MGVVTDRLKHAWNAFLNVDQDEDPYIPTAGTVSYGSSRPDRTRFSWSNEQSIISAIYTRVSIDIAGIKIRHIREDENGRYKEDIKSGLNNCLTLEANKDQAARAFRQDVAMSCIDEGVVAIVPVDTTINPLTSGGYDIKTLRTGRVVSWMPDRVRVSVYNDRIGRHEEVELPKSFVGIVENPLYSVMNEPNSTLQRLIRKLNLLDAVDEQSASGKLDIIIQLPYTIKSDAKRRQAEQRKKDLEFQLTGSKYGIAYSDATEKIVQLNRPAENNLMEQIQFLTEMLYSQLGLTDEVMKGTADENAMLNYFNRTIEPIVTAIVEELRRKFLTHTARAQGQDVRYIREPFKLVPIQSIADIADKMTRNEVLVANELREILGFQPHPDPKAEQLRNPNMPNKDSGPDGAGNENKEGDSQ